jgi:prolycopene isomerase
LRVTLVDKNPRIGGSCSAYDKRGFHVDIGTHMFSRGPKGPLGEVLRRVSAPGRVQFKRTRDIAEIRSLGRDGKLVCLAVPASLKRMPRFAWELCRELQLSPREAAQMARLFTHILTMSPAEIERWNHRSVEDFLQHFASSERILPLFGFLLGLYFILPYWEVSAGEALWCFQRMARDNHLSYPLGGSIAIPKAYCEIAQERGATVLTGCGVKRVLVQDGRVHGVVLEDGRELPADIVVSTSSIKSTVFHLVGQEHFPEETVTMAENIRGSSIAVQAKIALDRPLVSAGAMVGGVGEKDDLLHMGGERYREMFEVFATGRVPHVVPFYCPVPTNFDPSLAPEGCQLLTACALAPTTDVDLVDPAPAWEEAMMRALRQVVPNLDEHALFIDTLSVKFIERWIGKMDGPAVSTGQTPDQVGPLRPTVHTPIHGLYIAGCGAGGRGIGTELAASSALECSARVLADLGRPKSVHYRRSRRARLADRAVLRPLSWATRPRDPKRAGLQTAL